MKAVLFDLFETLVSHFDPDWTPPARSIAQRLGVDQTFFDENWGRFGKQWESGAIARYEHALDAFCAAAGVASDARTFAELEQEYVAYAARTAFARADRAIVAMLTAMKASGLTLGVITNANDLDTAPWARHELAGFFEVFVASWFLDRWPEGIRPNGPDEGWRQRPSSHPAPYRRIRTPDDLVAAIAAGIPVS